MASEISQSLPMENILLKYFSLSSEFVRYKCTTNQVYDVHNAIPAMSFQIIPFLCIVLEINPLDQNW